MVLQNYQNLIEMTSNIFIIIAFGGGFKCPRKIHLNTQCQEGIEGGAPLPGDFRLIVCLTPPQKNDFGDLLGTP